MVGLHICACPMAFAITDIIHTSITYFETFSLKNHIQYHIIICIISGVTVIVILCIISGVTVMLSLTVFQDSVSKSMPVTSLQIPLLGKFATWVQQKIFE